MEVIDGDQLPEEVLREIFSEENNIVEGEGILDRPAHISEDVEDAIAIKQEMKISKSNRFKAINDDQVDEIAGKSCKKNLTNRLHGA